MKILYHKKSSISRAFFNFLEITLYKNMYILLVLFVDFEKNTVEFFFDGVFEILKSVYL